MPYPVPSGQMRRTKIVATIGPASRNPETLARMVEAGMDVARLNFSHGSAEEHAETARLVREAAGRAGRQVAILQDLPGPKLRIGRLRDGLVELKPGDQMTFVCGENSADGDASRMFISWPGLAETVHEDEIVYLADGAVRLRITATRAGDGEIDAEVEIGDAMGTSEEAARRNVYEGLTRLRRDVARRSSVPATVGRKPS